MDALEETGLTPADPGVLPRRPHGRDRPGHRPAPQGRRRRRHPGPPRRRPPGRARRRGRPLDPRRRARARPSPRRALRRRPRRAARSGAVVDGIDHELVRRVATWEREDTDDDQDRRERLHDDAPHRPGQGRARRRLRRPAGAQRRQGRLLRQAHRRHGRRRGDLRQARDPATPRSAATRPRRRASSATSTPSSTTPTSRSSSAR